MLSLTEFTWLWNIQKQNKTKHSKALQVYQKKQLTKHQITQDYSCSWFPLLTWASASSHPVSLSYPHGTKVLVLLLPSWEWRYRAHTHPLPLPIVPVPAVIVELTMPRRKFPRRRNVAFWRHWVERQMNLLCSCHWGAIGAGLGGGKGALCVGEGAADRSQDLGEELWFTLGLSISFCFLSMFINSNCDLTSERPWHWEWGGGYEYSGPWERKTPVKIHLLYSANLWNTYQVPCTGWVLGI